MAIDREQRARLGARLRYDRRIPHGQFRAAQALLFAGVDARTGRCQMYRERIAREAGVSLSTVDRASATLVALGYLTVIPTYGPRRRLENGRWFRPRGASVFCWLFLVVTVTKPPSPITKEESKMTAPALPEGLSRVLERLGTSIAERREAQQRV